MFHGDLENTPRGSLNNPELFLCSASPRLSGGEKKSECPLTPPGCRAPTQTASVESKQETIREGLSGVKEWHLNLVIYKMAD